MQERVIRPVLRRSPLVRLCSDRHPGRWMRFALLASSGFAAIMALDATVSVRSYQRDLARNPLLRIGLEQLEPTHSQFSFLGPKQAAAWEVVQRSSLGSGPDRGSAGLAAPAGSRLAARRERPAPAVSRLVLQERPAPTVSRRSGQHARARALAAAGVIYCRSAYCL